MKPLLQLLALVLLQSSHAHSQKINREKVVSAFNPTRNASSASSPMQVGNGNFAFGADVTGLQTLQPWASMSSWAWDNASLPTTPGQTMPSDFTGLDWLTHGRLVNYDQPNPAEADISQWLTANPHRINLGRVGFVFENEEILESDLSGKKQTLDLYRGSIESSFEIAGKPVSVVTMVGPSSDVIAVEVDSELLSSGQLGVFIDYPISNDQLKFEAPFVGYFNATQNHTTTLLKSKSPDTAVIQHDLVSNTYFTALSWTGQATITQKSGTHRYLLHPQGQNSLNLTVEFSPSAPTGRADSTAVIKAAVSQWWANYWNTGAFIDLAGSGNASAVELQRRTILSQYLMAVNEAGNDPPQESGLVNNGWYGKFHMEEYLWHSLQWLRWNKTSLLDRSIGVYERFLPTSIQRAQLQGYAGTRWGKESDPSGRSAPGEINSLLIWQQPHIFYFAELEYRANPQRATLEKWDPLLTPSADFMASFAFWNQTKGWYDLGPPMYPASENTPPNSTLNPTFELAHWRFGLKTAIDWKTRLNTSVPAAWSHVSQNLAPLPQDNDTYIIYEGLEDMWVNSSTVQDHPALIGAYGLLPATPGLNETIMRNTAERVWNTWNFTDCWGWDFPMLSMNAARLGDMDKAMNFLLDDNFQFDDVGMPVGGVHVPTPYFPGSGALLLAMAQLAGGWDGQVGSHFPAEWNSTVEGFSATV